MYSLNNEQHMQRVAPPGELSPSQWDDYKESDEQLAPLPPARAPHVVSRASRACPAIDTWGSCESMADTFVLARSTTCVQPAAKKKPPCSHCGKTITGRPRHLHNKRICGRCELRAKLGLLGLLGLCFVFSHNGRFASSSFRLFQASCRFVPTGE